MGFVDGYISSPSPTQCLFHESGVLVNSDEKEFRHMAMSYISATCVTPQSPFLFGESDTLQPCVFCLKDYVKLKRNKSLHAEIRAFVKDYLSTFPRSKINKLKLSLWGVGQCQNGVLRVGSMCTGLGTAEMVLSHFQNIWNAAHKEQIQARILPTLISICWSILVHLGY